MHQISLLGGLGDARHGDGSHYMRPDRVYRTSVLQPMTGYQPGYDVDRVASAFTMGPQSGMSLGAHAPVGLRLKAWWANVKARARGTMPAFHAQLPSAQSGAAPRTASEVQVHAPGASQPPSRTGWGGEVNAHGYSMAPSIMTAHHVGPYARGIPEQMSARAWGQSGSLPAFAEEAAAKTTMMRWRGLRFPWG